MFTAWMSIEILFWIKHYRWRIGLKQRDLNSLGTSYLKNKIVLPWGFRNKELCVCDAGLWLCILTWLALPSLVNATPTRFVSIGGMLRVNTGPFTHLLVKDDTSRGKKIKGATWFSQNLNKVYILLIKETQLSKNSRFLLEFFGKQCSSWWLS